MYLETSMYILNFDLTVSVGYQFGETGGLISLQLPKDQWLRSDRDSLSFGFVSEAEDAVISHVGSATSNDYIEMKLVRGSTEIIKKNSFAVSHELLFNVWCA